MGERGTDRAVVWGRRALGAVAVLGSAVYVGWVRGEVATGGRGGGLFGSWRTSEMSAEERVSRMDVHVLAVLLVLLLVALGLPVWPRIWRVWRERGARRLAAVVSTGMPRWFVPSVSLLAVAFAGLYLALGLQLVPERAGSPGLYDIVLFGADVDEASLWCHLTSHPYHKGSHPLLPMLVAVPATGLRVLLGGLVANAASAAAAILTASFGGLAVALSAIVLRPRVGAGAACLLAAIYGAFACQVVFGAVAETYSLAACSVLPVYLLLAREARGDRMPEWAWVGAGVAAIAVTITNLGQGLVAFGVVVWMTRPRGGRLRTILEYAGAVVTLAVLLSLIQRIVFQDTRLFFLPRALSSDLRFVSDRLLSEPVAVVAGVVRHFTSYNVVAPSPFPPGDPVPYVLGFSLHDVSYGLLPGFVRFLWWGLLACGAVVSVRRARCDVFVVGALGTWPTSSCSTAGSAWTRRFSTRATTRSDSWLSLHIRPSRGGGGRAVSWRCSCRSSSS